MRKLKSFCIILISISVTNLAVFLGDIDLNGELTINDLAKLKLHLIGSKVIFVIYNVIKLIKITINSTFFTIFIYNLFPSIFPFYIWLSF